MAWLEAWHPMRRRMQPRRRSRTAQQLNSSTAGLGEGKSVEWTCKPNPVSLSRLRARGRGSFVCRSRCRGGRATYPDARADTGESIASLFGLAPQGVCHAVDTRVRRGALLPHRFTLTSPVLRRTVGGLFSVALSVAFPRLAVSQPAARRSSDFPRLPAETGRRDPPVHSTRRR